uniref:Uncharacterized protein n=1 Tax=Zea mays TaxID=4577 RepID=C4J8K3_MAIZE|nr:unknown [Zea mays]
MGGCTRHGLIGSCGRSCRTLCQPWLRPCRIFRVKPWRCCGRQCGVWLMLRRRGMSCRACSGSWSVART